MRTPGFSAEVVLDPAIQNRHYGGLFAGMSDQSGVIPQLFIADVTRFFIDLFVGFIGGVEGGGGGGGPRGGGSLGNRLGREVGKEVHCYWKTGKGCGD